MGYLLFLWFIKKCIFKTVIGGTFYQYLPYFQNKNLNGQNMQYENNLRKNTRFGFQKAFFQKVHLGKGGRLIIRVVLFSGQYGMFSIIKNNHFIRVIHSGIKLHLSFSLFLIHLKRTISHILIKSNLVRNQTRLVTLYVFDSLKTIIS